MGVVRVLLELDMAHVVIALIARGSPCHAVSRAAHDFHPTRDLALRRFF